VAVDLAGDVTLEDADDLGLGAALLEPASDVGVPIAMEQKSSVACCFGTSRSGVEELTFAHRSQSMSTAMRSSP